MVYVGLKKGFAAKPVKFGSFHSGVKGKDIKQNKIKYRKDFYYRNFQCQMTFMLSLVRMLCKLIFI